MTTTEVFGRLVDVEPRQAWAHEAHMFTPWLAENLDRLSEAVGIPLDLTGREVGVGRYSADILATNPQDGSLVLIENQLEWSDHTHLGQILTYLAGLEAHIVIWLAPQFREEHLSAIRWLNQFSDERFSFFAVRLRVVQIGVSPFAPLFEVLEKPNAWDRSLQKTVRAATRALDPEAASRRESFWQLYAERDPDSAGDLKVGSGASVRWRPVPGTGIVVSRFRSKDGVGIFLRGGRGMGGDVTLPRLEAAAPAIEQALGVPLGSAEFPFSKSLPIDAEDAASVAAAIAWLITETTRYERAAAAYLQLEA